MKPEDKDVTAAATLHSGELAARCGVSTDTLRFYERQGLLPRPPCRDVHAIAAQRLAELDTRIGDLVRLRDRLAAVVSEWSDRLRTLAPGQRAGLLERLADEDNEDDGADLDRRTRESAVRQSFTRNPIGYPMANADRPRRPTRRRKR